MFQAKNGESTHRTFEPDLQQKNVSLHCACGEKNVTATNEQCQSRDEDLRTSKVIRQSEQESVERSTCNEGICGRNFKIHASNERFQHRYEGNVDEQALMKKCNWTCNEIDPNSNQGGAAQERFVKCDHQVPGPSRDVKNRRQNDENEVKTGDLKECSCGMPASCLTNTPCRCQSNEGNASGKMQNQRICRRKSKEDHVPLKTRNERCASGSQTHVKHRRSTCSTCGEFTMDNRSSSTFPSKPIRIPIPKCVCPSAKPPRELRRDPDDVRGARPVEVTSEHSVSTRRKPRCARDVSKPKILVRRASVAAPCSCVDAEDSQELQLSSSTSSIEDTPGKLVRCKRRGEKLLGRGQNTSRCCQDRGSYRKRAEGSEICAGFSSAGVQKSVSGTSDLCKPKINVCDRETCTYNAQPEPVTTTQGVCRQPKTTPCIIKLCKPTKTTYSVQTEDKSAGVCVAKSQPSTLTTCERDKVCDDGTGSSSTCYLIAYKRRKRNDFPSVRKRQDKASQRATCSNIPQTSDVATGVKNASKSSFYTCSSTVESKVQDEQPNDSKNVKVIFKIDSSNRSDESIDLEVESWQQKGEQVKSSVAKGVSLEACGIGPHEATTNIMSLRMKKSHDTTCETQVESRTSESASSNVCRSGKTTNKRSRHQKATSTVSFQVKETHHARGSLVKSPNSKDGSNDVCGQKATSTVSFKVKKSYRTCGTLAESPSLKDANVDVCEESSGQQKATSTVSFRVEKSYRTTCSTLVESHYSKEISNEVCQECSEHQEVISTHVESKDKIDVVCKCSGYREETSTTGFRVEKSSPATCGASSMSQTLESGSSCVCEQQKTSGVNVQQTSPILPQNVTSSTCYLYQCRVKDSKGHDVTSTVPGKELISTFKKNQFAISESSEDSCGICSTPPPQEGSSFELSTSSSEGSCTCSISVKAECTQTSLEIPCFCVSSVGEESTATSLEMSCVCSGDVEEEGTTTSLEMSCVCSDDVEQESTTTSLEIPCTCSSSVEEECTATNLKELEVPVRGATLVASGESCTCASQQDVHASLTKPEQGDVDVNECTCSEKSSEVCWGSCRTSSTKVEISTKKPSSHMICECCLCNMEKAPEPTTKDQEVMVKIDSRDDVQVEEDVTKERSDEGICEEEREKSDDGLITKSETFVEKSDVNKGVEGTPSMKQLVEEMLEGFPSSSEMPRDEVSLEISNEVELSEVGSKAGESIKASDEFEQVVEEKESIEEESIVKEQIEEVASKGDVVEDGEEKTERETDETLEEETYDDVSQKLAGESLKEESIQEELNICKRCFPVCPGIPKELLGMNLHNIRIFHVC